MLGALGKLGSVGNGATLPRRVRAILKKYGATMLLPGVSGAMRFGYQPGNYRESTGQTLAVADQQVGLVVDAARSPGQELVTNGAGTDTSGWIVSSATVASISGEFAVTATTASEGICVRTISIQAGKTYVLSGNVRQGTAANGAALRIRRGTSGSFATVATTTANVNGQVIFTAPATENDAQVVMRCLANTVGQTAYFSNISVRELPGIHASQSTSGFQPVLRDASGIQSWQFDGTDDRLSLSAVPFQMADDHFVVAGGRVSLTGSRILFASHDPSASAFIQCYQSGSNILAEWRDNAGLTSTVTLAHTLDTPFSLAMRRAGANFQARKDAGAFSTNTPTFGPATLTASNIGMNKFGNYLAGQIHGIIFGKGAITDSELLTLERFVASLQGRAL